MNDKGFYVLFRFVRMVGQKLAWNLIKLSQAAFPAFNLKGD